MTFPGTENMQAALPPDTEVRIGIAEAGGLGIRVRVSGAIISCGFLNVTTTAGSPVALLHWGGGGGSSGNWLCLGNIRTQP